MKNFVTNKIDFSSNLNIAQANIQLELLKNELINAKAGYLPTASLDAKYTKYNSNDITVDYEDTTRIGLQVNIPLYNGGKTQSNILSSKLNIEATREDLIKIQKDIKINYEENLLIFNSSLESIKMYQESMESALLYLDSVSLGFNNGLKSIIDVNEAKNKLYEVEYRYIENLYEMIDAYVNILIVTNKFDGLKLLDKLIVK
jgi:outer membrane protein